MKRLLIIVLSILSLASCQKAPFLSITGSRTLTFTREGGRQTIAFTCNRDWSVSTSDSWCRVSPSSGTAQDNEITVTLTASQNTSNDSRSGTLSIKAEELSATLTINQDTGLGFIVSPTTFDLTNAAQLIEVEVQKNVNYSVTIDDTCRDWITQDGTKALTTDKVNLNIAANTTYDDREGIITFKQTDGNLSEMVVVRQRQSKGLFIKKPEFELSYESQTLRV